MSDRKVTISVQTDANTGPLDAAAKSVDNLSQKNEESAASGGKAKDGGLNAAKGFAAMAQTAAASSGSIGGLASALGGMAQQLPALAGSAGPIGLAIAAFMAWKKVVDSVKESQESLAKGLRDTAAGNSEARIKSLAKAYEDLQDAIAEAAAESQRYFDAENSKDDARTKADLAALDLEKARRSAALDPDDKIGGRRLDLDMAERRAAIEEAAAQRKADRELAALRAQAAAAKAAKAAAAETMDDQQGQFEGLGQQYGYVSDRMRERIGKAWTPAGRQKAAEEGERELARIAAAMEKAADNMRQAADTMRQADRSEAALGDRADVALINRGALSTTRQAGAVTRGAQASALARDAEADQLARAQRAAEQQAAAQVDRMSRGDAQRGVLGAERNLRAARNSGAGDSEVSALKAELDQARKARAEADRIIIENARQQAAQAAATAAAVKDIQARAARPGSGG